MREVVFPPPPPVFSARHYSRSDFGINDCLIPLLNSGVPRNFVRGGGSTNSVEDRGQRERGSGGGGPPSQGFWRQL